MAKTHILVIDQGTTSTRAIVFDGEARRVAIAQAEFAQHYPEPGWVEHDPEDIWRDVLATARSAIDASGVGASGIAAIGITNQRETVCAWDPATGEPLHVAGAFTLDGLGAPFVRRIEGDPSAVVGLSLPTLRLQLGRLGVTITDLWQG